MGALPQEKTDAIVAAYREDPSATLNSVAEANEVSWATAKKYIEAAGVPIRGESSPSDADLGIGSSEAAGTDIDAMLQNPLVQDAIARAVAAHLATAGVQPMALAPPPGQDGPAWSSFMEKMGQLTDSLQVQKPGYQKPLTPDELSARNAGWEEFFSLLRNVRIGIADHGKQKAATLGLIPHYVVGEGGYYGSTAQGETLFSPGTHLYLTTPPPEDFLPMNATAGAIMRAQMQGLGEPTPSIDELVAQAMMRARGSDGGLDIIGSDEPNHADDASIVPGHDKMDVAPKRTFGTGVPELKVTDGAPLSPGATPPPRGPVYVN